MFIVPYSTFLCGPKCIKIRKSGYEERWPDHLPTSAAARTFSKYRHTVRATRRLGRFSTSALLEFSWVSLSNAQMQCTDNYFFPVHHTGLLCWKWFWGIQKWVIASLRNRNNGPNKPPGLVVISATVGKICQKPILAGRKKRLTAGMQLYTQVFSILKSTINSNNIHDHVLPWLQPSLIRGLATPWTTDLHCNLSSAALRSIPVSSPVHVFTLHVAHPWDF